MAAAQPVQLAAAQPVQMAAAEPVQLASLQLPDQLTEDIQLSPKMLDTARGFNYEAVGGKRVRCLSCQDERVYNATRLKLHRCPPQ